MTEQDALEKTTTHAYRYKMDAARALHKALGLEGRRIKRIVLVFDVNEAVTATITEYVQYERHVELCEVLTSMGPWLHDITGAEDVMRQYEKP